MLLNVLLGLMLAVPCSAYAGDALRIATEGAYPPFNYVDDQGKLAGFDVDIASALCRAMNVECEIVAVEWDSILDGLENGDYSAIVASMAKTEERDKRADFTDRYYRSRSAFIAKAGLYDDVSPQALKGKCLSAADGTVQLDYLRKNYSSSSEVIIAKDTPDSYRLLAEGKIDLILSDALNCLDFLDSEQGIDFDFAGEALPGEATSSTAYIAVREGDNELRKRINEAIQVIRLDGTYERINHKYFPFSIY
ncbi:periplasmic component of amino acid ABC-type transporter/signal transduction system [Desulfovibrio ferrophilus]|uniref:Periplasmic component of amino acid ABC-type transporter/signal transduction system n=2 Tax=Desulfovibrio ferrophilus TaxID=241368 RepID=A0A2Z6AWH4_9BACT|nr:periplasmic component of amino acid ABC-type transporter/signal transduction system [Desulfovibrio ferrophilus]